MHPIYYHITSDYTNYKIKIKSLKNSLGFERASL